MKIKKKKRNKKQSKRHGETSKHTLHSKTSRGNLDLNCNISQLRVPSLRLHISRTKLPNILHIVSVNIVSSTCHMCIPNKICNHDQIKMHSTN